MSTTHAGRVTPWEIIGFSNIFNGLKNRPTMAQKTTTQDGLKGLFLQLSPVENSLGAKENSMSGDRCVFFPSKEFTDLDICTL